MDFKEIQAGVIANADRYSKKHEVIIDKDFALLKLYEEVGELAQAVLIQRKKSRPEKFVSDEVAKQHVAEELADVLTMVIINAHLLDIDLERAICQKALRKINKKYDIE